VVEQAEEVFEERGRLGAVTEDDDGGGKVLGRGEEHVQIAFFVCDGRLEVFLLQGGGRGQRFCVDFADEEGQATGARLLFQCENLGGYSGSEEERLPHFLWRQYGKTGFEIRQHAASAWCEEPVGFIKDYEAHAPEPADGVFARGADVLC